MRPDTIDALISALERFKRDLGLLLSSLCLKRRAAWSRRRLSVGYPRIRDPRLYGGIV